jgi:type 1 glutamine amidotransferase
MHFKPLFSAAIAAVLFFSSMLFAADPRPNAKDLEKINAALPETAPAKPKQARKVLVFTKATGFVHSSIPVGAKTFELMGAKTGAFTTVTSDDPDSFMPENLKNFDAVLMMSTTGSLFVPKGAREDLLYKIGAELPADLAHTKLLRDSLIAFVKGGKGIMGVHAATDSSYQWKDYGLMMGGYFNGHPWGHIVMRIEDPGNPVNAAFDGKPFEISDEIYTFKEVYSRERQHILTSIDLAASKIDRGFNRPADHDYAVSWLNKFGEGRVFYCSLGHAEATYWNPVVLKHYLAGLQFALGDLDADAKPSGPLTPERIVENSGPAAYAWQDIMNNDKNYRDKKDVKETSFTGTLEAIPADGVTTTQRASFYKLGDQTIFTGGKKNGAMDALIGKKVEIRGKAVDMELEGKQLHEIWPASVRSAKG